VTRYKGRRSAVAALERWRTELPSVPSAYKSSGKFPPRAALMMSLGVLLAVIVGDLLGLLATVIAIEVVLKSTWFEAFRRGIGIGYLLLLAAIAFRYLAMGLVSGFAVVRMGHYGKSRSPLAAGVFAAASGVLSVLAFSVLARAWLTPAHNPIYGDLEVSSDMLALALGTGEVWIILATMAVAWLAVKIAVPAARGMYFCEACEESMGHMELTALSVSEAKRVAELLQAERFEDALRALASAGGEEGSAGLWVCPACHRGCVEVELQFEAAWPKRRGSDEEETLSREWLVASRPLTADQTDLFTGQGNPAGGAKAA
jgi:hypothetical protein